MSRPKGSKNKSTLMKEQGTVKTPVKKVIKNNTMKEHVKQLNTKRRKASIPKYVLKLTDWLYITCDRHCWMIKEVIDKINPTTGEKYPDKPILFAGDFNGILKVAVNYMIRVPVELEELSKKIDEVYSLIDSRVPANTKPKNMFEVYQTMGEEEE